MYVVQWKTYAEMSLQGHRSKSDVSLVYKIPTPGICRRNVSILGHNYLRVRTVCSRAIFAGLL